MLTGKRIVLTGATSGIGLEVLKLLVKGDNKIFAVGRNMKALEGFDKDKVIPYQCDISTKQNVDKLFEDAVTSLGVIDIFYSNAGFGYYEEFDYVNWERVEKLYSTNVISVMYSYQKYREYLNGREGHFAITISAIGKMAISGYAVYSSSKFALNGFQEALRLERQKNITLTCLYPIATETAFFKEGFQKAFPVQSADVVARAMVKGLEKKKKSVNPSKLFIFSEIIFKFFPFVKKIYLNMEYKKFLAYKAKYKNNK
ncbi:MAG: SDR family NAD(P)-dependent oxidoreductase [Clostridia bacterium]|nr:SDR family NAD(P)-dependent oxidoreductase [Clostridia bacterium]